MSVVARSADGFQVELTAGRHEFVADEPSGVGTDTGPNPYDLLLSALAACKIMTVKLYARRKEWPLQQVDVSLSTKKVYARDCEEAPTDPNARVDLIEGDITLHGDLTSEQRNRLAEIAEKCPVQRTLTTKTKIRMSVVEA